MSNFKVGDAVRRTHIGSGLREGELCVISEYPVFGMHKWVKLEGEGSVIFEARYFELVEASPVPHIHQKEIIAWANGAEIQMRAAGHWYRKENPHFDACCVYRVKPDLTPTQQAIEEKEQELVKLKQQDLVERGIEEVFK